MKMLQKILALLLLVAGASSGVFAVWPEWIADIENEEFRLAVKREYIKGMYRTLNSWCDCDCQYYIVGLVDDVKNEAGLDAMEESTQAKLESGKEAVQSENRKINRAEKHRNSGWGNTGRF